MKTNKNNKIIKLLTSAALALPGLHAQAEAPPQFTHAEFGYGTYDESGPRYNVNIYQSQISFPVTEKTSIAISTQRDLQTGASFIMAEPQSLVYYGEANNVGNPSLIVPLVSGASIKETRDTISMTGSYYLSESIVSAGYRYSTEYDFLSNGAHIELRRLLNKKNTEITVGLGYQDNEVRLPRGSNRRNPLAFAPLVTGASLIESQGKNSEFLFSVGLRQDFSEKTTGSMSFNFSKKRGYLGDPYKRTVIYGNATAVRPGSNFIADGIMGFSLNIPAGLTIDFDRRPGRKESFAASGTLIHYIEKYDSGIHCKYEFVHNDWNINSNSLEVSYHQPVKQTWRVIPLVRYYTQDQAYFYSYMFAETGGAPFPAKLLPVGLENSSDNRLSRFGTFNAQMSIDKRFQNEIHLIFIGGVYASREWLHLGPSPEVSHPFNNYTSTYGALNITIDFI